MYKGYGNLLPLQIKGKIKFASELYSSRKCFNRKHIIKKQYNMKTLTDEKLNESFTFGYSLLGDQIELTLNQKTITLQKVK